MDVLDCRRDRIVCVGDSRMRLYRKLWIVFMEVLMMLTHEEAVKEAEERTKGWPDVLCACWHAYHDTICAYVTPCRRIITIFWTKSQSEHALRLKLLKPVEDEAVIKWAHDNKDDYVASNEPPQFVLDAHKKECREDCPWDGRTIFGKDV